MMRLVRFVGEEACSDAAYLAALRSESFRVVDCLTGDRNVTVQFTMNESPLLVEPDECMRDFMDLAVTVYIADELVKREEAQDRWTRDFDLLVPVFDPEKWRPATSQLVSTLDFLSQDRFAFTWVIELQNRVLSHGYFPASVGDKIGLEKVDTYQPWAAMIRRWANDVITEFEPRASDEMKSRLGFSTSAGVQRL